VDSVPETGVAVARLVGALLGFAAEDLFRRIPFVLTEALEYSRVEEPGLMLPGGFERDAAVTLVHAAVAADEERGPRSKGWGSARSRPRSNFDGWSQRGQGLRLGALLGGRPPGTADDGRGDRQRAGVPCRG